MKKFGIFSLAIALFVNCLSAKDITYEKLSNRNYRKELKDTILSKITLHFADDCPNNLSDELITKLLKKGTVIYSDSIIYGQGKYSNYLLNFSQKVSRTSLVMNSGNNVRIETTVIYKEPMISWWFIFGVVSIALCIVALRMTSNLAAAAAAAVAIAAAAAAAAIAAAAIVVAVVAVVAVAVVVVVVVDIKTNKFFKFLIKALLVLISIFMIFCYFQI